MKRQLLTALVLLFATVASWAQNAVAVYQNDVSTGITEAEGKVTLRYVVTLE